MKFRMLPPVAALATVLLLTGCVPSDPIITPEPEPDATPLFDSDEEALAAATEAYGKYLAVADEISADGGNGADRIDELVTLEQLPHEQEGFNEFSSANLKSKGNTIADSFTLQRYSDGRDGTASVVVYVCVDVSNVQILDESGVDVTSETRKDRVPLEIEFEVRRSEPVEILVERSEPWPGNDFC